MKVLLMAGADREATDAARARPHRRGVPRLFSARIAAAPFPRLVSPHAPAAQLGNTFLDELVAHEACAALVADLVAEDPARGAAALRSLAQLKGELAERLVRLLTAPADSVELAVPRAPLRKPGWKGA